jgi:hypothetical protein
MGDADALRAALRALVADLDECEGFVCCVGLTEEGTQGTLTFADGDDARAFGGMLYKPVRVIAETGALAAARKLLASDAAMAEHGPAKRARSGEVRQGMAGATRPSKARQAWQSPVERGQAKRGKAGNDS